jgi:hypothetical protein
MIITNRVIRRIIQHAPAARGYDPLVRGKEVNLRAFDDVVKCEDAVRGRFRGSVTLSTASPEVVNGT